MIEISILRGLVSGQPEPSTGITNAALDGFGSVREDDIEFVPTRAVDASQRRQSGLNCQPAQPLSKAPQALFLPHELQFRKRNASSDSFPQCQFPGLSLFPSNSKIMEVYGLDRLLFVSGNGAFMELPRPPHVCPCCFSHAFHHEFVLML